MIFKYEQGNRGHDILRTVSDHGVEVDVYFTDGCPDVITVDGEEFHAISDTLYGVAVMFGNMYFPLATVIEEAEVSYASMMADARREAAIERRHEMSVRNLDGKF